jgi:hypothetical protein
MRIFESSKISANSTVETDIPPGCRFSNSEYLTNPPGFGELGLHTNAKTFSTIRRKERVSENLRMAHSFLSKQLDGLSEIQSTLILWIKSKAGRQIPCGEEMIFMQPIENILGGTDDPLKFHYLKNGSRDFLEILIVPLLTQPSIASLRIASVQNLFVSTGLLESCGGEVMNQRMNVDSKLSQLNDLSTNLIQVPECKVTTQLGRSSSSNFLLNFFRKAFGGIDEKQRLIAKEQDLNTCGSFIVNPKYEQL